MPRLPVRRLPAVFPVFPRSRRRCFAFSSSFRRVADRPRPARLMKNWIMRTPDPGPLGLTDRRAIVRAIVAASLVKRSFGGRVETVFTLALHFRVRWTIVLASRRWRCHRMVLHRPCQCRLRGRSEYRYSRAGSLFNGSGRSWMVDGMLPYRLRARRDIMRLKKSVAQLVEWQRVRRVATVAGGRTPHQVPVCHVLADGKLYFASEKNARKVRNLRANPTVAVTVDLYSDDWSQLKGVMIQGKAAVIEKGPRFRKLRKLL